MGLKQYLKDRHEKFIKWKDEDWKYHKWPNHGKYGTLKMHENMSDFIHGSLIGLLLGFLIGGILMHFV